MRFVYSLWISAALTCSAAFGADLPAPSFSCAVPTTVFDIRTGNGQVTTYVSHPYGIAYTPMARGTVSAVSLPQLIKQSEILSQLGDQQKFTWPQDKCTQKDGDIYECTQGDRFELNGWKIRPILFRTYKDVKSLNIGDFDIYTVEIVFTIDNAPSDAGVMFSLSSDFSKEKHCRFFN